MNPSALFKLFTDIGIEFELMSVKTSYLCASNFVSIYTIKVKTCQTAKLLIDCLLDKTDLAWNYGTLEKGFYFVNLQKVRIKKMADLISERAKIDTLLRASNLQYVFKDDWVHDCFYYNLYLFEIYVRCEDVAKWRKYLRKYYLKLISTDVDILSTDDCLLAVEGLLTFKPK